MNSFRRLEYKLKFEYPSAWVSRRQFRVTLKARLPICPASGQRHWKFNAGVAESVHTRTPTDHGFGGKKIGPEREEGANRRAIQDNEARRGRPNQIRAVLLFFRAAGWASARLLTTIVRIGQKKFNLNHKINPLLTKNNC